MIYVVYREEGVFKIKSKGLAKKLGLQVICEFGSFYHATDWIHSNS